MEIVTSKIKRTINFLGILFLSVLFMNVFLLTSVHADNELLVKWPGITGNILIAGYPGYDGYFQALDSGMTVSNNCQIGVNPPECKAVLEGYTITKYADFDSTILAARCVEGDILTVVKIASVCSEGNKIFPIWEVELEEVKISRIASAVDSTNGRLAISFDLTPQIITWKFYLYDSKGNALPPTEKTWNVIEGKILPN